MLGAYQAPDLLMSRNPWCAALQIGIPDSCFQSKKLLRLHFKEQPHEKTFCRSRQTRNFLFHAIFSCVE
jgi:hypothetical protein